MDDKEFEWWEAGAEPSQRQWQRPIMSNLRDSDVFDTLRIDIYYVAEIYFIARFEN